MNTELRRKKVSKSNLTRLKDKINTVIETGDRSELELLQRKLKNLEDEFFEIFRNITEKCEENELEQYTEEKQSIDDIIDELSLSLNRKLSPLRKTNGVEGNNPTASNSKCQDVADINLPKLSLPTFSGKLEEWLPFKDLFNATITKNDKLSGGQKLQYLKSSLRGDALKVVQSLPLTDSNFKIAYDLLEQRFSHKRDLVSSLVKKIVNLPNLQGENSIQLLNMVDTTQECVQLLKSLEFEIVNFSDTLLMFILQYKLDNSTRSWWERSLKGDKIPTLEELLTFLKDHARALQASKPQAFKKSFMPKVASLVSEMHQQCSSCKGQHALHKCSVFLKMNTQKRVNIVKNNNLCFNCLSSYHRVSECKTSHKCKTCGKPHHTLLHFDKNLNQSRGLSVDANVFYPQTNQLLQTSHNQSLPNDEVNSSVVDTVQQNITSCVSNFTSHHVLLCTALIRVLNVCGDYKVCRALLDPGSQVSFITNECLQTLGLSKQKARVPITCLGATSAHTNGISEIQFVPHFSTAPTFSTSVFVIQKIIGDIPHVSLNSAIMEPFKHLTLADPTFCTSSSIDILLGVDISLPMLRGDLIKRSNNQPFAISSDLGWIVSGNVSLPNEQPYKIQVNNIQLQTDALLTNLWNLDSVPVASPLTKEEKECEEHFQKTHSRDESGRYKVRLPFHTSPAKLGNSKEMALRRFHALERKLISNVKLHDEYKSFISEYIHLNHMEPILESEPSENHVFYLPHHAVHKDTSTTTKVRVVFDASAKSSSGLSLNDILMIGPRVQQDLVPILMRFRTFPVAICSDIEKMYRQINVQPDDANLQRIFWRNTLSEPIITYRLKTVTYGTASAPFLATRTIKQLAIDEEKEFPLASKIVSRDFYVDDLLSGAETIDDAQVLVKKLSEMLQRGGFSLRKWISNEPSALALLPDNLKDSQNSRIINSDELTRVLGLQWNTKDDNFEFSLDVEPTREFSKRNILSEMARIYDPLGWLAPCVIFMKIFLQRLWFEKMSWDEPLSEPLREKWRAFHEQLHLLSELKVPRLVLHPRYSSLEIHAFCDASEKAYCAAVYIRSLTTESTVKTGLLTSKTRVAPLKTQSLPRLELCAALLLANLVSAIFKYIEVPIDRVFAWSDSKITLVWISSEPCRWQTFVANRVAQIQEVAPNVRWQFIQGVENPADCATRGLLPHELLNCDLWLKGPEWLRKTEISLDQPELQFTSDSEILKEERKCLTTYVAHVDTNSLFYKYSSYSRLIRIIAWCLRFKFNCLKTSVERKKNFLTSEELRLAEIVAVKHVQMTHFPDELLRLSLCKPLEKTCKILQLTPFIDSVGILRVGGRLRNASLSENEKHPILLPRKHHITEMIIKHYHLKYLHAGSQLLASIIRQKFWIVNARDVIRNYISKCVTCCRYQSQFTSQLMADLPTSRVNPSRVFSRIGVDFAGPFDVKYKSGRGVRPQKCYVCLFVCFVTRAVHLEIVGDLSAKSFTASLKRFIARRGKPFEIHSDCGTNFVGTAKQLRRELLACQNNKELQNYLADENIKWKFNPPSAPHFGGLWEAGIKSMKYHLRRCLSSTLPTYEEFLTLLTQIEACLNSRPLVPASSDPSDFEVLTPGHFIIGASLTAVPEADMSLDQVNYLDRWKRVQKMFQQFWKRWSSEYLARLQQRPKWCQRKKNVQLGDLVLIKDDNLPPLRWKLGRVTNVHPGKDGLIRVVTLRTATGELQRPVVKLCPLPLE